MNQAADAARSLIGLYCMGDTVLYNHHLDKRVPAASRSLTGLYCMQDLALYKKYREKQVATAARSLIGLFRELAPAMLEKKDRGRGADLEAVPLQYGAQVLRDRVEGADLLERAEREGWLEGESEGSSDEEGPDADGEVSDDEEVGAEGEEAEDSEEDGEVAVAEKGGNDDDQDEEDVDEDGEDEEDVDEGGEAAEDAGVRAEAALDATTAGELECLRVLRIRVSDGILGWNGRSFGWEKK